MLEFCISDVGVDSFKGAKKKNTFLAEFFALTVCTVISQKFKIYLYISSPSGANVWHKSQSFHVVSARKNCVTRAFC